MEVDRAIRRGAGMRLKGAGGVGIANARLPALQPPHTFFVCSRLL